MAFVYQVCCKMGLDDDLDDCDDDEEPYVMEDQEEWHQTDKTRKTKIYRPYGKSYLEALRKARVKEIKNQAVASELMSYLVFLGITFLISYANRDADSFILKNHVERNFIQKHNFSTVNHFLYFPDVIQSMPYSRFITQMSGGNGLIKFLSVS